MVKRGVTKGKLSVTIDKTVLYNFTNFCKTNAINRSQLIEKLIINYLREKE